MNHFTEFSGLKVGKRRIEQKNLVRTFMQTFQRLGTTGGLGQVPWCLIEPLSQALAQSAVRAYEQHTSCGTFVRTEFRKSGSTYESIFSRCHHFNWLS